MGWFEEQIRMRREADQDVFEDALFEMASVVLGKRGGGALKDRRIVTKAAIDEILKYYHCKPTDIPESIKDPEDQLEYALRPHGVMYRNVTLSENWYRDAYGSLIVHRREDGMPVVLLPRPLRGYYYRNANGVQCPVNRKTMALFLPEALCFYSPLPLRRLGIPDLIAYMKGCLDLSDYILLISLTVMVTLVGLFLPRITAFLSGFVLESGNGRILMSTAVFMLSVLVVSQMLTVSRELAMSRIQIKVGLSVQAAMMMRLMSLPASFFKDYSAGELASRSGAINQLCDLLFGSVFSLGLTALSSLLYIRQIFLFAPALVRPALLVLLATVAVTLLTSLLQLRVTRAHLEHSAKEAGLTYSLISGVQKIKLAGAEKRAFARWAKVYSEGAKLVYDPPTFLKINSAVTLAVSLVGTIAIYILAVQSGVSDSHYLAFSASYGAMTGAFTAYAGIAVSTAEIKPILELAEPILKAEPEGTEEKEPVTRISGSIELTNVSFRYDESMPYVIDGLNLKIRPGEYLAIVGATGCGKSTLMRLLLGFETPEKGAIYYDGRDMRSLDLHALRRNMGVVTQDGSLFQGDIFSNITVSAPHLSMDDAWEAAELAGVADDIRAMPMGMHTMISEGQGGISGGQRQRLMIARAVAPKPRVLLFDEATSALDNKTQKQVSQALDGMGCTRIVIAHRLSTIQHCSRILVLDKGKIAESGTYDELIGKDGIFAELVSRQRLDGGDSEEI